MSKKSYVPFAAWVTQFRNKIRSDAFFAARMQLMLVYFATGALIFMLFGWVLGSVSLKTVYQVSLNQDGQPVKDAFTYYREQVQIRRLIMSTLFVLSTYFFAEFALRPVKKSVELQKRFIATVSHELRTPLTIMKNTSEVALRNPSTLTVEKATEIIKSNLEETNRLSDTVQFLLTFSLLKNQKRIAEMQTVSLRDVIEKVLPVMQKESEQRDVHLTFAASGNSLVKGNSVALEGIITNLIKNAIYHTSKDGIVTITLTQNRFNTQFSVADTGKGILKKDLPYIFEPFYRGDAESKHESTYKGYGLGLSIVKEIADLHHASVNVDSVPEKGSTFSVVFPRV